MNNNIARQESEEQQKKEHLIQQISRIREKISQLSELQSQIATIENLVKTQQSKTSLNSINSSRKIEGKARNNSNSNRKIKIYQLKKKLEGKGKDYKERHISCMGKMKRHEELVTMITETNEYIRNQKDNSGELDRLHASLVADINRIQQKCNQNSLMLKSEKEVLSLCEKEKAKRIAQIKRLKKIINSSSENTEPDDEIAFSVNQPSEDERNEQDVKPLNFKFELSESNSPNLLSQNRKYSDEQILIEEDEPLTPAYISFKKSKHHRGMASPKQNSLNQSKDHQLMGRSYLQLQDEMLQLQEKIEKDNKLYESLLESASLVKKGNRNLEASAKHSMVTLDLLKNRLQNVVRRNELQKLEIVANIEKCDELYEKLRAKEGERGQIRGKLGIKVQNTRILGIINQSIALDLLKISERVPRIKNLEVQCLDLIKRLIGPQKIISENLNDDLQ